MNPALAIGPANHAGQAHAWARAVARHTPYEAWSFTFGDPGAVEGIGDSGGFGYEQDRYLGHSRYFTPASRGRRVAAALAGATHVALDGFLSITAWPRLRSVDVDARALAARGLPVALVAHGSEVRDPAHHRERNAFSYYGAAPAAYIRRFTRLSARNRRIARTSGLMVFVSTPDLLWDLPEATWLPVTVEAERWRCDTTPLAATGDRRPVVLHLPSKRIPPTKGTHLATPILRHLDATGVITYLEPAQVPHVDMPELVASADVVVDQIAGDAYGVAAVEAMAAGRIVLAGVHGTRAKMPAEPPITDVAPDTLGDVVRDIAAHPETYRERAAAGPAFAHRWHDGTEAAARLGAWIDATRRETSHGPTLDGA